MDLPQPEDGGPSRMGNLTLIDKGFEKVAKEARNRSRLGISPLSSEQADIIETILEVGKYRRSSAKLGEIFTEALGLKGEQGVDGDDEDAKEEIATVELMIRVAEHYKVMADQKLKNLLEARALSLSHNDKVCCSDEGVSRVNNLMQATFNPVS
ncbi:hypothetical protein U1Q18_025121 [Sarracenia purpurea var. burkii]